MGMGMYEWGCEMTDVFRWSYWFVKRDKNKQVCQLNHKKTQQFRKQCDIGIALNDFLMIMLDFKMQFSFILKTQNHATGHTNNNTAFRLYRIQCSSNN